MKIEEKWFNSIARPSGERIKKETSEQKDLLWSQTQSKLCLVGPLLLGGLCQTDLLGEREGYEASANHPKQS